MSRTVRLVATAVSVGVGVLLAGLAWPDERDVECTIELPVEQQDPLCSELVETELERLERDE